MYITNNLPIYNRNFDTSMRESLPQIILALSASSVGSPKLATEPARQLLLASGENKQM